MRMHTFNPHALYQRNRAHLWRVALLERVMEVMELVAEAVRKPQGSAFYAWRS